MSNLKAGDLAYHMPTGEVLTVRRVIDVIGGLRFFPSHFPACYVPRDGELDCLDMPLEECRPLSAHERLAWLAAQHKK